MPITNTIFSTLPIDLNIEISKRLTLSDLVSLSLTSKQTAVFFKPTLQKYMAEKLLKHIIDGNERMIHKIININPEMMFNEIKHHELGRVSPLTYIFSIHYSNALVILFNALRQKSHITLFYNKLQGKIEDINLTKLLAAEKKYNNIISECKDEVAVVNEAWNELGHVQLSNIPMHLIRSICPNIDMIKRPVALYARAIAAEPFHEWSAQSHYPLAPDPLSRWIYVIPAWLDMKNYYFDLFEKNKINFIKKINAMTQLIKNSGLTRNQQTIQNQLPNSQA